MKKMMAFLLSLTLITGQLGITSFADDFVISDDYLETTDECYEEAAFGDESFISSEEESTTAFEDESLIPSEEEEPAVYEEESVDDFVYEDSSLYSPGEIILPEQGYYEEDLCIEDVGSIDSSMTDPVICVAEPEELTFTSDDDVDNDKLFDSYLQRMIDSSVGQLERRRGSTVGSRLEGMEKLIYETLKTRAQSIAIGGETSSIVEIPVEDAIEFGFDCGPWTAEQLGVNAIYENGKITDDVWNAVMAKLPYNMSTIMNALLADLPLDLYWYKKSSQGENSPGGVKYTSGFPLSYTASGTAQDTVVCAGCITVKMYVSSDYAASGSYFDVDPTKINTATAAIQRAQDVVSSTSGSVLNCITQYKEYICDHVSYNDGAADDNNNTPYGNPWQLIWVFDEDPNTNVVCEGYSKAFKYLFDLSNFGDDYDCLLVSGNMYGSSVGRHMWNVVKMDDGRNYHVDVTNCDEGMIGAPNDLFMAYGPSGSWDLYSFTLGNTNLRYEYVEETLNAYSQEQLTISSTAYEETSQSGLTTDEDGYYLIGSYAQFKEAYLLDQPVVKIRLLNDISMGDAEEYNLYVGENDLSTANRSIYIDFAGYSIEYVINNQWRYIVLRPADVIYVKNSENASISRYGDTFLFSYSGNEPGFFVKERALSEGEFPNKYSIERCAAWVTGGTYSIYVPTVQTATNGIELGGLEEYTIHLLRDINSADLLSNYDSWSRLIFSKPYNYSNELLTINFNFDGYGADAISYYQIMNGVTVIADREINAVDNYNDPIEGIQINSTHWSYSNNYTIPITFNANGGSFGDGETIFESYGAYATKIRHYPFVNPPEGKILKGWSDTSAGTVVYPESEEGGYTVNGPITLYAIWADVYAVTFDANGGTFVNGRETTQLYYCGVGEGLRGYVKPDERDSYIFAGWSFTKGGEVLQADPETGVYYTPTGNITLYAVWEEAVNIILDADGGKFRKYIYEDGEEIEVLADTARLQFKKGAPVNGLREPDVKNGKKFLGWSTTKNSESDIVDFIDNETGYFLAESDRTLYAIWTDAVTVTLYGNGGYFGYYVYENGELVPVPEVTEYMETAAKGRWYRPSHPLFEPEGKAFRGWSQYADGHEMLIYDYDNGGYIVPETDIELYAIWQQASARVNNYNYIEFEDAVFNATWLGDNKVITLLDDVVYDMPRNKIIRVDKNGHTFTVTSSEGGYLVHEEYDSETGIYTYSIVEDETMPRFTTHKLLLSGEIGVGFRVAFPEDFDPAGCYVSFVSDDQRYGRMQYEEAENIPNSSDRWFMFYINALELQDGITATIHYGNGQTLDNHYSAMEYIDAAKNNSDMPQKVKDLVSALERYGYYLQRSGWTDGKDHYEIWDLENELTENEIVRAKNGVADKGIVKELGSSGIGSVMFSLTLNAQTRINISVRANNGVSITSSDCKPVSIGGKTYYQFTTDYIGAGNLGLGYPVTIDTDRGVAVITASAMSYVRSVLNSSSMSTEKKYAMTAFYDYCVAAENYNRQN